jgi:peptide/nickel transport system substrate-binding protein
MKNQISKSIIFVLLVACIIMLAGCANNQPTVENKAPIEGNDAPHDEQTEDNADKIMRVAVTSCPNNYNPYASTAGSIYNIFGKTQVYDTLFTHDESGNIIPSIVEDYEISSDNLTFTMKLHQGIKFSNGEPFTSEDAKYSIDLCRATKSMAVYFESIENIETPDEYTLVMKLKEPNAALLENLTLYGQMVSKKAHEKLGDEYGMTVETIIGTGPYVVTEFTPEQSVTYVANEEYFKGEPSVKKIEVETIVNDESALIALQTGEFDYFMSAAPAIAIEKIKADPNLELVDIPSKKMYYICLNCETGPFSDPNMRKAISLAINRDELNIMGTEGLGTIVYYPGFPTNTGNPDINDEVAYHQDQEEARRLIKEAGYEGATITISMENNSIIQLFATALQNQLEAVGLKVQIDMMEYTAFMSDVFTKGNYEMTMSFNTARTGDMDFVWTSTMHSGKVGSGNTARYVNPEMDDLLKIARGEMNTEARKEAYVDCIELYLQDLPFIPITYEYSSRIYNKNKLSINHGLVQQDNFYNFKWND